ncbi:MAG: HEAT repeat domain-containing protein [Anaerolineae bacterium]|nr:HEAT repeat domain-containing protein [Anaerolineae bacterium]
MKSIVEVLIERLGQPERGRAIAAAAALGRFGGPEACTALGDALATHADSAVRSACADALGRMGGRDAACALVRVLGDRDRVVWQSAAEALMGLDDDAMPAVVSLFQSREQRERRAALSGLLWLTVEHDESEVSMSDDVNYTVWGWWN